MDGPKSAIQKVVPNGNFRDFRSQTVVKITKETLTVDSDHATFKLLSESDFAPYHETCKFMHIGLI